MDLTLGPEQESVRDAIRGMLADRLPLARIRHGPRSTTPSGARPASSAGSRSACRVRRRRGIRPSRRDDLFVELGRALAPGPWLGTLLAAHALGGAATARRVAVIDDPADALVRDARLAGAADAVADAADVDAFLVVGETRVRRVAADARGLTVAVRPSIDPTRPLARVRFEGVVAEDVPADAAALRARATVLVAAEAVGVAERTLEASVAYAKVRQQFGRPIGSFQAVKHRCADMAVRAEVARSITTWAAIAAARRRARCGNGPCARRRRSRATRRSRTHPTTCRTTVGWGSRGRPTRTSISSAPWVLEHQFGSRSVQLDALARAWAAGC
jgi:hypothetical protein